MRSNVGKQARREDDAGCKCVRRGGSRIGAGREHAGPVTIAGAIIATIAVRVMRVREPTMAQACGRRGAIRGAKSER